MSELTPGRDVLRGLLRVYNEQPEQRERIAAEIEQRFRRAVAILVIDNCSFSRMTRDMGIIHTLALHERLDRLIGPILMASGGGRLLRTEGDNTFVVFPDVSAAVACAAAIAHDVSVAAEALPAAEEIHVAIGIGYGEVLIIGSDDVYGHEMNVACKLGEDLAARGEVLLTPAAYEALGPSPWEFEPLTFSTSGLDIPAYRLVR